ncbi:glycoside hydrolase family 38 N-terminal domain-containing protein [Chitinophaga rhizophila]|uniref:Glycoside hydrolase n=1 Tax=Chitinophaga rhizophila TaxID=2866212 RepID=A0ABS7G9X8_9BACT|nr:glycoside hydrolase family 38 C-terminal domain-containing protein [Chitinophaga rhizophila]MBW8683609.1 glycoside hydrolase [Chitinophaga rhizophila]
MYIHIINRLRLSAAGKYYLLLLTCLAFHAAFAQSQPTAFTSIELTPTVAYLRYNGQSARMVRLVFHGGKSYAQAMVYMQFNGLYDSIPLSATDQGIQVFELPLPGPAVQRETQLSVRLTTGGKAYTARCMVAPAPEWKVYLLPHSHVDIGYTNVQEKVMRLHMNNIDEAIKIAQRTKDYPPDARYKWNTEAFWVVDHYLAAADEDKKKAFWEAVKKGWINIDGAYANINTSITDSRQLMQMFHTAVKTARQQGINITTMFQGDVPGASWGLASQADITGIRYFWGAPNADDRIGLSPAWRDRPFYWQSPGKQQLLYWQSEPYSIGYRLKGSKIPNFFTVEDPTPYYTGHPSDNFLNPYLFDYLAALDRKKFPYNMTIMTWAMSDNAPIDPELPDAVKAWNERYTSPRLIITSVKQFFTDFEAAYADKIPVVAGDYTEYWTDGIASAARETGYNRIASETLQQADAIWALRNKPAYPATTIDTAWNNILLFNEHTWGAHNSISHPDDPKAISQWNYKQSFARKGREQSAALLTAATGGQSVADAVDIYNTIADMRTALAIIPADQSKAGDLVRDSQGRKIPSQRLSTGELAVLVQHIAPYSKQRYTIHAGKAYAPVKSRVAGYTLQNDLYKVSLDERTGNISLLERSGVAYNLADSAGLNRYSYLPGDSLEKVQYASPVKIRIKENGPLVVSAVVDATAPGAHSLTSEVRLTAGVDRVEIINTLDKKLVTAKEGVHFAFPFNIAGAQIRYSIPWGSVNAEADQLQYANRNWYAAQRWVDVSNQHYGVTWSTPDAPLFEIGTQTSAGMVGGLHNPAQWISFTEQRPAIFSWVMNNLWHTNFRHAQEGVTTFRYYLTVHHGYDAFTANQTGLANHRPLITAAATGPVKEALPFSIQSDAVYVESIKPAANGNGVIVWVVNTSTEDAAITLKSKNTTQKLYITGTNILEDAGETLSNTVVLPGKGIRMLRVENK